MNYRLVFLHASALVGAIAFSPALRAAEKVDFDKQIKPILESSCVSCHHEGYAKGGLRLDLREKVLKGGENGPAIVPGKPKDSILYKAVSAPPDADEVMPP